MTASQLPISAQFANEEKRSQHTVIVAAQSIAFAMAVCLAFGDMRGALLWFGFNLLILAGPTFVVLRGIRLPMMAFAIPVLVAIDIATITLFVHGGYSPWLVYLCSTCVSTLTREKRGPVAATVIVLVVFGIGRLIGHQAPMAENASGLAFNILVIVLMGAAQYLVTSRTSKMLHFYVGAAEQEERLAQSLTSMAKAAEQMSAAGNHLEDGTRQTTEELDRTLLPGIDALVAAQAQSRKVQAETMESMAELRQAISQIAAAMTDQTQRVTQATEVVTEIARSAEELAGRSSAVAHAAGTSANKAGEGSMLSGETLNKIGDLQQAM